NATKQRGVTAHCRGSERLTYSDLGSRQQEVLMAWASVQDNEGLTLDIYDRVTAELGDDPPAGLIVHTAGTHGNGVRIIDVWESEDAWTRFRDERLGPAVAKVVGPDAMAQGPPPVDAMEVHNMLVPGS